MISANGKDCSSLSHTELIAFLRKIGNDYNISTDNTNSEEVELRLYRDASEPQTPTSPSTEMHSKQSDNPFPSPCHSNNKMATMSHPNLPSFLNSSNSNSGSASSSKNHKRLRQEAKEMVIVESYVFLPRVCLCADKYGLKLRGIQIPFPGNTVNIPLYIFIGAFLASKSIFIGRVIIASGIMTIYYIYLLN